jgi:hypothetical protein
MDTQANKLSYDEVLRTRAMAVVQAVRQKEGSGPEQKSIIYTALKETALESWKNGLQAGKNRAREGAAGSGKSFRFGR